MTDKQKPNLYAILPAKVRYASDITPSEKLLYAEITALSTSEGYCSATNAYIGHLLGVAERSVSRQIAGLAKGGYIRTEIIRVGKDKTTRKIYPLLDHVGNKNDENQPSKTLKSYTAEGEFIKSVASEYIDKSTNNISSNDNVVTKKMNEAANGVSELSASDVMNTNVQHVFDHWNRQGITVHKNLTEPMKQKLRTAIKNYGVEEVIAVINNYSMVYHSPNHYFDYKYTLLNVLRPKDMDQFSSDVDMDGKFLKRQYGSGASSRGDDNMSAAANIMRMAMEEKLKEQQGMGGVERDESRGIANYGVNQNLLSR